MRFVYRAMGVLKICLLKIKYGNRLKTRIYRHSLKKDTEIACTQGGVSKIGSINAQNNVHLVSVGGNLSIGEHVNFNRNDIVICRTRITIGDNCSFGPNVCIYDHDHVFNKDGLVLGEFNCSEIVIENNCWIGAGVIILRGSYIGKNSVVGAGVVVKGDIPANSLVKLNSQFIIQPLR